jgi:hypothetical protein
MADCVLVQSGHGRRTRHDSFSGNGPSNSRTAPRHHGHLGGKHAGTKASLGWRCWCCQQRRCCEREEDFLLTSVASFFDTSHLCRSMTRLLGAMPTQPKFEWKSSRYCLRSLDDSLGCVTGSTMAVLRSLCSLCKASTKTFGDSSMRRHKQCHIDSRIEAVNSCRNHCTRPHCSCGQITVSGTLATINRARPGHATNELCKLMPKSAKAGIALI